MSDFDEWLRAVCFQRPTDSVRDLAMDAWNHQQARIAELEAAIREHKREPKPIRGNDLELYAVLQEQGE